MEQREILASKETRRLQDLLSYGILDTPYEEDFDSLVKLITLICDCPIAIISLMDDKRQWYKAKIGTEAKEVPREETFCQHTILQDELVEITDARSDERVKNNKHVQQEDGIRFYAGLPLKTRNGNNIGTVCVVDTTPKALDNRQKEALQLLTQQTMALIEARKKNSELGGELEHILDLRIKETDKKLSQKESEYNDLLRAIKKSNGVVEFSPDGIIIKANNQFLKGVGYTREELVNRHHSVLLFDEQKMKNDAFWDSLKNGDHKSGRLRRKAKNGKEVWIQATYNPIIDENQNIKKIIKISQDISAEIRAEKVLQEEKDHADALNAQKDFFIANVSHEIRTPIHAILGFTEILLEQETHVLKSNYLKSVKTAGDNLLFIINDILDLSKIESGIFQIEKERFEIKSVVQNVFSILHLKAQKKKIPLKCTIGKDVPTAFVGDKNRLNQILINLLGNALKFTSAGKIELIIKAFHQDVNQAKLQFAVSDTGVGIPADKLESIFQRFSQAEQNTSRKYGGTGLGLNISKLLIEKQGGEIKVESELGKGSVFTFWITYDTAPTKVAKEKKTCKTPFLGEPANILLCEDNELNQRLILAILKERGHVIDLAENGKKGLDFFKTKKYDLVLMDIQMPEMDGYQTTKALRENFKSDVPIIALTANFMLKEKTKCLNAGMNDYLSKPFTKNELLNKVEQGLFQNSSAETQEKYSAPLSFGVLKELSGGNKDFEREMKDLFMTQVDKMLPEMKRFFKLKNYTELSKMAHKLKSSFGVIGADTKYLEILNNISETSLPVDYIAETLNALEKQLEDIFLKLKNH